MRRAWVMGWAVPTAWFAAEVNAVFPGEEHEFFEPTDDVVAHLEKRGRFDWVVGYSLGAHLLLAEPARVAALGARVGLLAPFAAFAAEEALGGRVARTQVRYLSRWVRRERVAALNDFYARAGLEVTAGMAAEITMETLAAGLARLESGRVDTALPDGWRLYAGDGDALLDAGELKRCWPGLEVVAGATHHPRGLLQAWKQDEVNAGFSRAAGSYGRHARVQTAAAAWLAEWVPAERGGRALEVGAGTGIFTRHLVPWSGQLVATDASEAMCARGRAAWPETEWRTMSAETPDAGPWDWIFTSSMLQWVDDPAAVFSAWRKMLAPGGRVVSGLFAEGSLPELRALMGGWSPVNWQTPEAWGRALADGGLRVVRTEARTVEFRYASAREFLRSLHGVGATPARRLSVGALRRLMDEYERRYATEGGVKATWTFYRFEAERASLAI